MARSRSEALPMALFALAVALAGALLLTWLSDLTFWRDEWGFLLERRGFGADVFLEPHYEHIAISLIAVYKALQATFGMESALPFQLVATATFLLSIALLYVYVARRVGRWAALAAALPILVLGPAWDDLLWPFQLGFFASMSAGLGALLALEREDRLGDLVACGLLTLALTFSSLGIPFVAGAAVHVAWDRSRWRRAYVAAVPAAFYALWWLGWGHEGQSYASLHNFATSISYVADGFAASISSLLGLAGPRDQALASGLDWGRSLVLVAIAVSAWRLVRVGRVARPLAAVVVIAVAFWFLAGLNASIFREPTSGRYQYMGAVFVVLIAAELWRGSRPQPRVVAAVLAVACLAALSNLSSLRDAHSALIPFGDRQPAALAALELTRDRIDPQFELTEQNSGVDYLGFVDAASYFDAADAFGSPAMTPTELAAAPEIARASADTVLAAALELELEPVPGARPCPDPRAAPRRAELAAELTGPSALLVAGAEVEVRLRRFASASFPVELGSLESGEAATLAIPRDRSAEIWQLQLPAGDALRICPQGGGE